MSLFTELIIYGSLAGLFFAIIGALKDTPYEGFHITSFCRGILIGTFCGFIVYLFLKNFPETIVTIPLLYIFTCAGLERQLSESYKNYIRIENQKKYRIPEYAAVLGHVIKNRTQRMFFGAVFLTAFFTFLLWLRGFLNHSDMNYWYKVVIASGVGGAYVSLLGADKDAPFEGFEPLKLCRSFIIAILFGVLFSQFINDWIVLGYTAIGAERVLIESYKKFVLRKKPGKFK